jgi:two-component system cell cycle sensor histidine kinase/response regulator CckA
LDDVGHVNADKPLLQQALWNLCVNACEAMPTGGRLTIRTKLVGALHQSGLAPSANGKPSQSVEFSVADVGTGVPPQIHERIFEPFFTTKKLGRNCGLGLATAYGIVEQHGGTIHFESSHAFGSTFYILVPSTDCEAGGANWNDRESCDGARTTESTLQLIDA